MNWYIFFIALVSFVLGACTGALIFVREIKNSLR